jgi:hypothetical protein
LGKGETPTSLAQRACTEYHNFGFFYHSARQIQQEPKSKRLKCLPVTAAKSKQGEVAIISSFLSSAFGF